MGDPTPFSADPRLVAAEDAIHAAEDMFVQVQSLVQSECLHRLVVQSNLPTHVGNFRVCTACRLVEEGSLWSYDPFHWAATTTPEVLGNSPSRVVVQQPKGSNFWPWRDQMTYNTLHTLHTLHTPEEPPA